MEVEDVMDMERPNHVNIIDLRFPRVQVSLAWASVGQAL